MSFQENVKNAFFNFEEKKRKIRIIEHWPRVMHGTGLDVVAMKIQLSASTHSELNPSQFIIQRRGKVDIKVLNSHSLYSARLSNIVSGLTQPFILLGSIVSK